MIPNWPSKTLNEKTGSFEVSSLRTSPKFSSSGTFQSQRIIMAGPPSPPRNTGLIGRLFPGRAGYVRGGWLISHKYTAYFLRLQSSADSHRPIHPVDGSPHVSSMGAKRQNQNHKGQDCCEEKGRPGPI